MQIKLGQNLIDMVRGRIEPRVKNVDKIINSFSKIGVNKEIIRKQKIIVSMKSFPARMSKIHYTLYSLLTQTLKPDMVVLWLAKEQFPNREKDIPAKVLKLIENGLTIKWCDDIKSYKKLLFALKEFPKDLIITADDDLYYNKKMVKNLYKTHLKNPKYVIANRFYKIKYDKSGKVLPYREWKLFAKFSKPSYSVFPTTGGGVLYPPKSFDREVFNLSQIKKLSPTADDVWFWGMLVKNKTIIYPVKSPKHFATLETSKVDSLYSINVLARENNKQISAVINHYNLYDILNKK